MKPRPPPHEPTTAIDYLRDASFDSQNWAEPDLLLKNAKLCAIKAPDVSVRPV